MSSFPIQTLKSPLNFETFKSKFCEQNDLRYLGSGAFAEVVSRPKSKDCYKISALPLSGEDAYLEFLRLVREKKDNPFFPKIKALTFFEHEKPKQRWYVVQMEKLKPLHAKTRSAKDTKGLSPMTKIVRRLLEDANQKTIKEFESFLLAMALTSKPGKQLLEAVQVVKRGFGMAQPDLHDGNMMLRDNGELVITDPIAFLKPKLRRR